MTQRNKVIAAFRQVLADRPLPLLLFHMRFPIKSRRPPFSVKINIKPKCNVIDGPEVP